VIIGKKGQDIDRLRQELAKRVGGEVSLNINEVRKPEVDAKLIAENIAQQLERRVGFRRAMKRAVQSAMRLGAQGVRINCAGRLGGAEIASHASCGCGLRRGIGFYHLWCLRHQGVGVQGRDP